MFHQLKHLTLKTSPIVVNSSALLSLAEDYCFCQQQNCSYKKVFLSLFIIIIVTSNDKTYSLKIFVFTTVFCNLSYNLSAKN